VGLDLVGAVDKTFKRESKSMKIKLSELQNFDTQTRAAINEAAVQEYADAMTASVQFPPIVVFHDSANYWVADGFHRILASRRIGAINIEADVKSGTRIDAIKFGLGANISHGVRRTNDDKARAAQIALKEFPTLSSREIAKICGVSATFIESFRAVAKPNSTANGCQLKRTGADGKARKMPSRSRPATEPAPEPVAKPTTEPENPGVRTLTEERAELSASEPECPTPETVDVVDGWLHVFETQAAEMAKRYPDRRSYIGDRLGEIGSELKTSK